MCGIIGFTGHQNASQIILQGLKTLEYRGYDSAGLAIQNEAGLRTVKASGQIKNLCEKTHDGADLPGFAGIGHTRWATHGAPTDVNAHPHVSANGKFAIIHNGIVENFAMLREELTSKGYEFKSETDTEVIAHLLECYYTGDFKLAVMKATARLEGAYALGVICSDFPGVLYAVKEASPLIIGLGAGENFFASDVTALVNHTKNVIYLEDGEFAELTKEKVTVFDGAGREVNKEISRVTWDISVAEKGGYDHFMLKEIMEQPRALKATIEPRIKDEKIVLDNFDLSPEELKDINKIIITACGSAYYAGCH